MKYTAVYDENRASRHLARAKKQDPLGNLVGVYKPERLYLFVRFQCFHLHFLRNILEVVGEASLNDARAKMRSTRYTCDYYLYYTDNEIVVN